MNQDVLRGKLMQVDGTVLQMRGQVLRSYRDFAMGQLRRTAGLLQERRGVVTGRLARARRRMRVSPMRQVA